MSMNIATVVGGMIFIAVRREPEGDTHFYPASYIIIQPNARYPVDTFNQPDGFFIAAGTYSLDRMDIG